MFGQIILGLFVAAIGALVTIKSEWIYQNFGPIPFFDQHLHTEGGSRLGYKLIGIVAVIVGFLIMTNLMDNVLLLIFSPLFPGA